MKKHITTVNKAMLNKTLRTGGCGESPAIFPSGREDFADHLLAGCVSPPWPNLQRHRGAHRQM